MQASRLLIGAFTAFGVIGLAGLAVAQTGTTTQPGSATVTTPGTTTTVTPPAVTTETDAERLNRERLNAPTTSGSTSTSPSSADRAMDRPMDSTARRDANGNLIARADRN